MREVAVSASRRTVPLMEWWLIWHAATEVGPAFQVGVSVSRRTVPMWMPETQEGRASSLKRSVAAATDPSPTSNVLFIRSAAGKRSQDFRPHAFYAILHVSNT